MRRSGTSHFEARATPHMGHTYGFPDTILRSMPGERLFRPLMFQCTPESRASNSNKLRCCVDSNTANLPDTGVIQPSLYLTINE